MSKVVFDSDENVSRDNIRSAKVLGLTGWLMRHSFGVLNTERKANVFMVLVAAVFFLLSFVILFRTFV